VDLPAGTGSLKRLPGDIRCCSLIYKDAHFKDGRRIRPLFASRRPRRNHCIPTSEFPALSSLPAKAETSPAPGFLLSETQPLRWVAFRVLAWT
jgi:hypothetical protein